MGVSGLSLPKNTISNTTATSNTAPTATVAIASVSNLLLSVPFGILYATSTPVNGIKAYVPTGVSFCATVILTVLPPLLQATSPADAALPSI